MTGRNRRNFSLEFRLEAAQLVLDQHYTVAAAATAMNGPKPALYVVKSVLNAAFTPMVS